jgi:hypothetical protein
MVAAAAKNGDQTLLYKLRGNGEKKFYEKYKAESVNKNVIKPLLNSGFGG